MKPAAFDYARPGDVAAALALGSRGDLVVKYLAGGQSLGPMLNLRLVQTDLLVDLTGLSEMSQVAETADALVLGACVTHADIEDRRVPDVTRGALAAVARGIAYRAVRNRGTIGGSLCHADPAADWVSSLAALGATAAVHCAGGRSDVAIEDFVTGAFETMLPQGGLLESIRIPRFSSVARWGYYKICRKTGEFAHAIGVVFHDPARSVFRAVIGATEAKPIVFGDANALFGGKLAPGSLDEGVVHRALVASGILDPVDQKLHLVALRRAAERAMTS